MRRENLFLYCLTAVMTCASCQSEPKSIINVDEIPSDQLVQYDDQQVPLSSDYGFMGAYEEPVFYDNYNPFLGPPVGFAQPEQPVQPVAPAWNGNLPPEDWPPNNQPNQLSGYIPGQQAPNNQIDENTWQVPGGEKSWAVPVIERSWSLPADNTWQGPNNDNSWQVPFVPSDQVVEANYPPDNVPPLPWNGYFPQEQWPVYDLEYGPEQMDPDGPCLDECLPDQPELIPVCDVQICNQNCIVHMGKNKEGACFDNECYCKDIVVPIIPLQPEPKIPREDLKTQDWTYGNQYEWQRKFPDCGKLPQSPARLKPEDIRDLTRYLRFIDYEAEISFIIENAGQLVRMYVQGEVIPSIEILGLKVGESDKDWNGNYTLAFLDLHWGSSEHEVEGKKFQMEVQLHHFNSWFNTYEEAVEHPGQTMAIAILFEVDPKETALDEDIFKGIAEIRGPGGAGVNVPTKTYLQGLTWNLGNKFGVYLGSQSHPPCRLGVYWLVAQQTYKVGKDKLSLLKNVEDVNGEKILLNTRDLARKLQNKS